MFRSAYNYVKYSYWCKPEYEEILDESIKNSDILIVGLTWCIWTQRVMNLLKEEYSFTPRLLAPDVVTNEYKVELLYCMCKKLDTVKVPQIWVKGRHIGNFEHLYKMHYRKQLDISKTNEFL